MRGEAEISQADFLAKLKRQRGGSHATQDKSVATANA
jgi:hypothetical protein